MDMNKELYIWLNGRMDFQKGIILYSQLNPNKHLLNRFLNKGDDLYNIDKLHFELENRLPSSYEPDEIVIDELEPEVIQDHENIPVRTFKERIEVYPDSLQQIIFKRNKAYRQRDFLHAELYHLTSEKERFNHAEKILELSDIIFQCWHDIDHFHETGEKPIIIKESNFDSGVSKQKRINAVRTYISKYKKKVKEATSIKDREKYQNKLEQYEREIKEIEEGNKD